MKILTAQQALNLMDGTNKQEDLDRYTADAKTRQDRLVLQWGSDPEEVKLFLNAEGEYVLNGAGDDYVRYEMQAETGFWPTSRSQVTAWLNAGRPADWRPPAAAPAKSFIDARTGLEGQLS